MQETVDLDRTKTLDDYLYYIGGLEWVRQSIAPRATYIFRTVRTKAGKGGEGGGQADQAALVAPPLPPSPPFPAQFAGKRSSPGSVDGSQNCRRFRMLKHEIPQ